MQILHSPTSLQAGGKRTRLMGTVDSSTRHYTDDHLTYGKPSKRCRSNSAHDPNMQQCASTSPRQSGLFTHPGLGSKGNLRMQHYMPSPTVLNMYQPFLRQLAAGIAAGLAAGAAKDTKGGPNTDAAAGADASELHWPVLQEAGINIAAFFQPMVQMMMKMMTAGAHSAAMQDSNVLRGASQGVVLDMQGRTAHASAGAAADQMQQKGRAQSARSVADKSAVAKVLEPTAANVEERVGMATTPAQVAVESQPPVQLQGYLQLQHPFKSSLHRLPSSPDLQHQQQPPWPAGTWMSSSSSSAVSSSWAGPAPGIKSPTTSINGMRMPPRPTSTTSKQQQRHSQQQQQAVLSPAGRHLTSPTQWVVSPSSSALPPSADAAAAVGVRGAPGPEDSRTINLHRQHILLLERRLGNMHPEVGQAYLALAQTLTQEGSLWSLAMSERAQQRAAQILESFRQRSCTTNLAWGDTAAVGTLSVATPVRTAAMTPLLIRTASVPADAVPADAYVYVTATQSAKGCVS